MANRFYHSFHSSGKGDTTFPSFSEGQYQQHNTNSFIHIPSGSVALLGLMRKKKKKKVLW